MSYHLHGVGDWPADTVWNPAAGQAPRNDPRIIKRYSTVYGTWNVQGDCGAISQYIPGYIQKAVKARLSGWTVNLVGNGWQAGGSIKLSVIVPSDTALGTIRGAFFDATTDLNNQRTSSGFKTLGASCQLINPQTIWTSSDIKLPTTTPSGDSTTPGTTPPVTPSADGSATPTPDTTGITSTVSGIPMWAIGVGAVGVVGLLGYFALSGKKKAPAAAAAPAAAVAANRRRRSYRRAA